MSSTGPEIYRVPSFFDEPGATISAVVRAELLNEVRRHRDEETVERITHLLQGIFQGVAHAQEVYRGYFDDLRNTDNAWVETTVYHHHFSRELGGLLPFGHKACRAIWVSIYDRKLRISNPQWIQTVQKFIEYEFSRPGLLQLVVRWGRNDIAQMVLNDKELADQRQATHVQRALQDALERAKEASFDAQSLVDLLIEHGAEAAGIFPPDLFRNMRNDSFGFCDELRNNKFNKDRTRTLWQRMRGRGSSGSALGAPAAGGPAVTDEPQTISPWLDRHVHLMLSLPVHGFEDYARTRPVVQPLDLMCWAILVGSLDLAHLMWQRTRSPLRAGLIALSMCEKIKTSKNICVDELENAMEKFSKETVGVLEHLTDKEEVRKLLTGKHGEFSTLGIKGHRKIDILELAIDLKNQKFVAHRHCQNILDEQYNGRAPQCGLVKFGKGSAWVELNDLHPSYVAHQTRTTFNNKKHSVPHYSVFRKFVLEIWRIPKVKNRTQMLSLFLFVLSFCSVAFQPLCGPINFWHGIFFAYLVSMAVQEIHQMSDLFLYSSNAFNILDIVLIVLLFLASVMRFLLIDDWHWLHSSWLEYYFTWEHARSSLIEIARATSDSTGNWTRPELLSNDGEEYPQFYNRPSSIDECEVTVLLDVLRSLVGVAAILSSSASSNSSASTRRSASLSSVYYE